MKKTFFKRFLIVLIAINLVVVFFLYFSNIYPIKHKNNGYGYTKNQRAQIYDFSNKENILDSTQKELITWVLNNKNIFENSEIIFHKYSELELGYNDRHGKAWGGIILIANKESEQQIQELLLSTGMNLSNDKREFIVSKDNFKAHIDASYKYNSEKDYIKLYITCKIPYRYKVSDINNYDKYTQYLLKLNENNRSVLKKNTTKIIIKDISILVFLNLILSIGYILITKKIEM